MNGRKTTVSREHLIAGIPIVRVVERIRIDVPTVTVPVDVHGSKNECLSYTKPSVPPPAKK